MWHYISGDVECGPVSDVRLRELARAGEVLETSLVWKAGLPEWVPASQIRGLFSDGRAATNRPTNGERVSSDDGLDSFSSTFRVLDILFGLVRGGIGFISLAAFMTQQLPDVPDGVAITEIAANFLLAATSIMAAALILRRKRQGIALARFAVVLTVFSQFASIYIVYSYQLPMLKQQFDPAFVTLAALLGGGLVVFVRGGLLLGYVIAVRNAARLIGRNQPADPWHDPIHDSLGPATDTR